MNKNRPIRTHTIKRTSNIRDQIHNAVQKRQQQASNKADKVESDIKYYQDQLNKGNDKVESLKGQIVTTKRNNDTFRVTTIAAMTTGVFFSSNLFLQSGSDIDNSLRYALAFGAIISATLVNKAFNESDITLKEMLNRTNRWAEQDFTPEEVQTFKELYDEVKTDFIKDKTLKKSVKNNFVYQASQAMIIAIGFGWATSAFDKLNSDFLTSCYQEKKKLNFI